MKRGSAELVPRLHLVTNDETLARSDFVEEAVRTLEAAGSVSAGGPSGASAPTVALHLRGPRASGRRMHDLAVELQQVARATGSLLVVNDRVDVALAVGGAGIHLGGRSLRLHEVRRLVDRPLGLSIHTQEAAAAAQEGGADWAFAGHLFETPTHPGASGRGTEWLRGVVAVAGVLPILAIGGITRERVTDVLAAGAAGIAVLGGIWNAPDPVDAVLGYIEALNA